MDSNDRPLRRKAVFCLAIFATLTASGLRAATAERLPGQAPADDLVLAEDRVFSLDGVELDAAEIYFSPSEVFYLVTAAELEKPLMISPRGRSVQRIDPEKVTRRGAIAAEMGAGAAVEDLGRYASFRDVFTFEVDGKEAALEPRPPVLGEQSLESMREQHRRYDHRAKSYELKRANLQAKSLRRGDVVVKVFFVSTKPICERVVPRVMRFEEELRGTKSLIRFEYVGLPEDLSQDETARELGIFGVPAAIVYADGVEIGRLGALALDRPEENLLRLLAP